MGREMGRDTQRSLASGLELTTLVISAYVVSAWTGRPAGAPQIWRFCMITAIFILLQILDSKCTVYSKFHLETVIMLMMNCSERNVCKVVGRTQDSKICIFSGVIFAYQLKTVAFTVQWSCNNNELG